MPDRRNVAAVSLIEGDGTGHSEAQSPVGIQRPQGVERDRREQHAFGRLLDEAQAAAYLNVSKWVLREMVNAGVIAVFRIPRPRTGRAMRHKPIGDMLRRRLFDRHALDALVDRWGVEQ